MSAPIWDGIIDSDALIEAANALRQRLADAAKAYDWPTVFAIIADDRSLINTTRPGGKSRYTALHQAAHGGAAVEIVERLIALGAWRTLRNSTGERAVDIARRRGHRHLIAVLEPVLQQNMSPDIIEAIQQHFHRIIRERMTEFSITLPLRLPEIETLLETEGGAQWFPIPGMYGGFHYWLTEVAGHPVLISESWCRVVGGSGQRHLVSPYGSVLLADQVV